VFNAEEGIAMTRIGVEIIEELELSRAELERDRRAWEQMRADFDVRYGQHLERIENQAAELGRRESALNEQMSAIARAQAEQQQQAESLHAERQEIQREWHAITSQIREDRSRLEQERAELEQLRAATEAERRALDAGRLEQQTSGGDESRPGEPDEIRLPTESDPIAITECAVCEGNEDEESLPTGCDEPTQAGPQNAEGDSSDEQSIEEYMAALLGRTRGGSSAQPGYAESPRRRKHDPPTSGEEQPKPEPLRPAAAERVVEGPMRELSRRAPAENTDLSAMRALANSHVSIALTTHGKRRFVERAVGAWLGALVCLTCALAVLWLAPAGDVVSQTGSMVGVVAAIYWILVGVRATTQLHVTKRKHLADLSALRQSARKTST
jgi:hypothetical protein